MDTQPTEVFRSVANFPGYQVSNLGRVRSYLKPGSPHHRGRIGSVPKMLKSLVGSNGYLAVNFHRDGKQHTRYVHEIVLEAFVCDRPVGSEVRHLDGNKANVAAWNLMWGTKRDNEDDKLRHGTRLMGESHHQAKLTESDVLQLRRMRAAGRKLRELAAMFGISKSHAYNISTGRSWSCVG